MDKDLLLRLFRIGNSSGNEQGVSDFVKNYFDSMGISYTEDAYGNIFNLEDESLPILNAHMDSVQSDVDEKLAQFVKIRGNIMSGYGVIGGDDKCGIFVILEILKKRKVNFILTREEEIGCVGINHFMNTVDIKNYPWALTLDRYGSSDIICEKNDYGTKEFENALYEVGKKYGYKPNQGVYSDADFISEDVSCANISVGYYAHHTNKEYVVLSDLENSIAFVNDCCENITTKFDAPEKFVYAGRYHGRDFVFDDDEYYAYYETNMDKLDKSDDVCFVTKKRSKHLVFLPSLNEFISPDGARKLFEDLEQSGILYDGYCDTDFEDVDDIDELIKGVI